MATFGIHEMNYPTEPGWYIFEHKRTKEYVVRLLKEDGVLYDHRDTRYDHASQWREYYCSYKRIYFEVPNNFEPTLGNEG